MREGDVKRFSLYVQGRPRASVKLDWNVTPSSVILGLEPRIHTRPLMDAAWILGSSLSMMEGGMSLWSACSEGSWKTSLVAPRSHALTAAHRNPQRNP